MKKVVKERPKGIKKSQTQKWVDPTCTPFDR